MQVYVKCTENPKLKNVSHTSGKDGEWSLYRLFFWRYTFLV